MRFGNGKTAKYLLALSGMALLLAGMSLAADDAKDQTDISKRIVKSAEVLNEIMATLDKAIPDKVMDDAKCIAVVPSMLKIAVGFGGQPGKGVAY
jgi:lipid-binding SYLF domain-containing protein